MHLGVATVCTVSRGATYNKQAMPCAISAAGGRMGGEIKKREGSVGGLKAPCRARGAALAKRRGRVLVDALLLLLLMM